MLLTKMVSSMEKCFPESRPAHFPEYNSCTALRGMQVSYQIFYMESDLAKSPKEFYRPILSGSLAPYATLRTVEYIPSLMPGYPRNGSDTDFLRLTPGLFPDLLLPLHHDGCVPVVPGQCRSLWVDIRLPREELKAGKNTLQIALELNGESVDIGIFTVILQDGVLPVSDFPVSQWFHCDCLADYYHVPIFSERHWEIIENFMRVAVHNGINTILTPVFTPPLDTHAGGERPTVQLVDMTKNGDGYKFSYERLDRWVALCEKVGMKYFEISHLFTQWGAEAAPKIIATVDGEERQIFNCNTDATGAEYISFLQCFLPDLIAHMKEKGLDHRCFFHISDEPNPDHIDKYRSAKNAVAESLKGYITMDALSDYCYYEQGLVETPIVATHHMEAFLEHHVENAWAYYCCASAPGVSNRFFAMTGWRTRSIGYQMYANNSRGFLQWGYNFYYNQGSYDLVNPYLDSTGNYFSPSGDCYSVYPAENGEAYESIRILQFREGLEDRQLLELAERRHGRKKVEELMKNTVGKTGFRDSAKSGAPILLLREKMMKLLK